MVLAFHPRDGTKSRNPESKSVGYDIRADIDATAIDRDWTNTLPTTAGKKLLGKLS